MVPRGSAVQLTVQPGWFCSKSGTGTSITFSYDATAAMTSGHKYEVRVGEG